MAPEQTGLLAGASQGPTTDIYGLGAILYEMLVGRPPFGGSSAEETIRQVVSADVVPPRRLRPDVPRDLDTICSKCLERDPGRRYTTAVALAEELERVLEGRPILARPAGAWENTVRWCRRKPAEARLILALVVAVLAGFAAVTWLWRRAELESARARHAAGAELRLRTEAQAEVAMRDLDKGIALAQAGEIDQGLLWMAESIRRAPEGRPEILGLARANLAAWGDCTIPLRAILEHQGVISRTLYCDDGRAILTGSRDGTARFWDAATGRPLRPPIRHGDQIYWIDISRDGRRLATGGADRKARLWDAETGRPIGSPMAHPEPIEWVTFSPDGQLLLTRDGAKVCRLWDAATGDPVELPSIGGPIRVFVFMPDGSSLVARLDDGVLRSRRTANGPPDGLEMRCDSPILGVFVAPGSRQIATTQVDGIARVWDPGSGRSIGRPIPDCVVLAFSPDGRFLLAVDSGGRARLWDPATGRDRGPIFSHPPAIERATFSPDGRIVLTGGTDHTARLWDVATGRMIGPALRHRSLLRDVQFARDGRSFLTSGDDGTVKVWGLDAVVPPPIGAEPEASLAGRGRAMDQRREGAIFEQAIVRPDRDRILLRSETDGLARMVATSDGQPIGPPLLHGLVRVGWVAINPAGGRFATSSFDRPVSMMGSRASTCQVFDAATGGPTTPMLPHMNWPARLAFSPDGEVLATGDFDGAVHLWEVSTGHRMGPPLEAGSIVQALAFSPDGRLLAAGTAEIIHQLVLWDLATRRPRGAPIRFKDWACHLAFSPDGSRLAVGSHDSTARLVNAATGLAIGEPLQNAACLGSVIFSPDGSTLLTATRFRPEKSVVRSWDAVNGRPRPGSITLPATITQDLAFAPDGTFFAAGCDDGSVSLWDVAAMRKVGPTRILRGRVAGLAFSSDGASLLTVNDRGHLAAWTVPRPSALSVNRLARQAGTRTGVGLDPAGQLVVLDAEAWRRLREEDGDAARSSDPSRALAWHEDCARDAEAAGDGFGALWHLDRLIAARPGDGLLHARRALARLREVDGDTAAARSDLDRALELGPRDRVVDWLAHRAEDLRVSGRASGALLMLDRAVAARPEDWRLHALCAEAFGALGRTSDRDAEQARAIDLGADIPVLMRIAEERAQAGRHGEAALLFDRAIARDGAVRGLGVGCPDPPRRGRRGGLSPHMHRDAIAVSDVTSTCPGGLGARPRLHAGARRARRGWQGPGLGDGLPPPDRRRTLPCGAISPGGRIAPTEDLRGRRAGRPRGCRLAGDGPLRLGRPARRPGHARPMPAPPRPGRGDPQSAAADGRPTSPRGRTAPLR